MQRAERMIDASRSAGEGSLARAAMGSLEPLGPDAPSTGLHRGVSPSEPLLTSGGFASDATERPRTQRPRTHAMPDVHVAPPSGHCPSLPSSAPVVGDDEDLGERRFGHLSEDAKARRRLDEAMRFAGQTDSVQEQKQDEPKKEQRRCMRPDKDVLRTFGPARWLSDGSISFAYSLLNVGEMPRVCGYVCSDETLPDTALLVDPATAFWLALEEDPKEIEEAKKGNKLDKRYVVLCPINDAQDASQTDAGTHWSLLVCWRQTLQESFRCTYYDTLRNIGPANKIPHTAQAVATRLAGKSAVVHKGECAQQSNYYDCGVYVVMYSAIIVAEFLEAYRRGSAFASAAKIGCPSWEIRLMNVTPQEATEYRQFLYERSSKAALGGA